MKLTQAQIARLTGNSQAYISKLCREKMLDKNNLDTKNEALQDFLLSNSIDPASIKKAPGGGFDYRAPGEDGSDPTSVLGLSEKYLNMTIRELVTKHGDIAKLKAYVDILNKLLSSHKIDVDIQMKRGELLPRSFFEYLISYVNNYNQQLFDFATAVAVEIIPLVKNNEREAHIKIPELLKKNFSKYADNTIKTMKKELKKYEYQRNTEGEKE
jgi:transcriptional regulator with XRE-family HTH domain